MTATPPAVVCESLHHMLLRDGAISPSTRNDARQPIETSCHLYSGTGLSMGVSNETHFLILAVRFNVFPPCPTRSQ